MTKLDTRLLVPTSLLAGLAACAAPTSAPPALSPAPAAEAIPTGPVAAPAGGERPVGAATITPVDFYARVSFLASDALRGRDTPSQGLEVAAAYLVSEYRRLGLEPAGENGTFYQWYPFARWALDSSAARFGVAGLDGKDNRMLAYGTDFYAAASPGGASGAMGHARLAYAGQWSEAGLPAGEYAGAAPVVVVPGAYSRDFRTAVSQARRAAHAAGAVALVVVAPDLPAESFRQQAEQARQPQQGVPSADEIPVVYLSRSGASAVAARAGRTPDDFPATVAAPIVLPGVEAHFALGPKLLSDRRAPNVVAVLRGSDPALRDEYVILSAHMDHVGVGRPVNGDSIYNGADDDASGTSALVEVAEAFASLPQRPRRSIIFLNVSGEEKGLLGSRWYSDHPTVPLRQVVANVNVDMIGRNSPDSVVVIGKDYSSLGQVVNAAGARHRELGLTVSDDIWPEERFFFRSDHFNFARKDVPALFFFTGVHEDYHQPSDEVEKLNVDKAARVARLIFYTVQDIANAPQRPIWDPKGLQEVRALTR